MDLKEIFTYDYLNKEVTICGWIRNHRKQAHFGFIDFSDGTCFKHLQIVYDETLQNFEDVTKMLVGCAIKVTGTIIASKGDQDIELSAKDIILIGDCPEDYPIQPKRHTKEFLRSVAYLRPRTNLFQAVFRIRNVAAIAIHNYFQSHNYVYAHTPLITTTDCEGENQMFKITTFDLNNLPLKDGKVDTTKDLFGNQAYITGTDRKSVV